MPRAGPQSASAIRENTPSQSPRLVWRKSRAVGYQGLSSRPSIHRQSQTNVCATQTGAPSAPARCTSDESQPITRSTLFTIAAVSRNGPVSRSIRSVRSTIGNRSDASRICSAPGPFCRLMSVTPGNRASGSSWVRRKERRRSWA